MSLQEGQDDDPFACFGDSDGEETAEVEPSPSTVIASSLMAQANERMARNDRAVPDFSSDATKKRPGDKIKDDTVDRGSLDLRSELNLWPKSQPKYLGPIKLVSSLDFGGGRGYVATKALDPGTLVLVEEPIITWPQEQLGKELGLVSVRHILQHDSGSEIVRDLEVFYPTKQEVDQEGQQHESNRIQIHDMMKLLREKQDEDQLNQLVQLSGDRGITSQNGEPLTALDVVRILLVLRYNGLESGVYRHVAMLNHSCLFNCVKYQPMAGKSYSEVRTTRSVAAGESLTISYMSSLVCHATRRRHLWEQHRFDIGDCITDPGLLLMELVQKQLPPSSVQSVDEAAPTWRVEAACTQLEKIYNDIAPLVANENEIIMNEDLIKPVWDQLHALELSSLELYTEAKQQLRNDHHLLLIRCLKLHMDTSCDVLKDSQLNSSQRINLLCRMAASAHGLVELQAMYYGKDHFDVARTYLDLAQTFEELLARAPKKLLKLNLKHMTTFEECATFEHTARTEYRRIQALYPNDFEERLKDRTS